MKKRLFVFVASALMATGAFAQVSFGAKAGINLSKITSEMGDESETSDSRLAPAFGAFMNYQLSDKFSIQPELMLSMEGSKDEESEGGYSWEQTNKITFINIPVMAKANIANGLYLEAGPQLGFKMSAKYETEVSGGGESETEDGDIEDIKSMNFSLGVGAGYEMESGLGFGLRYNLGLSNMYDGEGDAEYKINTIFIGLSYKF